MNEFDEEAQDNPFRQVEGYWAVRFIISHVAVEFLDAAFEDIAVSVSTFEDDPEGENWQVEVLMELEPTADSIDARLDGVVAKANIARPPYTTEYLPQKDWVSEVQKHFPPVQAGRFFIHGSHYQDQVPAGAVPIHVDAGLAFGSGEHETTSSCLEALDDLEKDGKDFQRLLDMGCGSGILAIGMAKLWHRPIVASDIDEIAVEITERNAEQNGVGQLVIAVTADGYKHDAIRNGAPYDIIVANVLARPLIAFAPDLAANLAPGGFAVLSGLLARQEDDVLGAHEACGLKLVKRYERNGWNTLLITK